MTLFESIGELFDVIHNNQVVANVQVFKGRISLADNLCELSSGLA